MQSKQSVSLSLTQECQDTTIYYSKQNKIKSKTKMLQEQHISYETIKIQRIEREPDTFVDEEGMPWASPSFNACTSWIFLGVTWASPSLSFCPFFISLYHSSLPTLENSLHTKLNTILISSISILKIIDQLWFNLTCKGKHPR